MSMFEKQRKDANGPYPVGDQRNAEAARDGTMSAMAGQHIPIGKATIGPTLIIKGDVISDEDIVLAGQFEGTIEMPKNTLTITTSGRVQADIKTSAIEIEGRLTGDVDSLDKVMISKTGHMEGNITAPRVILNDGAKFKGRIDMNPTQVAEVEKPKPPPKTTTAATGEVRKDTAKSASSEPSGSRF